MTIILGIDPGSRKTGFGVIKQQGRKFEYIASGVIHVAEHEFAKRLKMIFESIQTVIERHNPEQVAIEQVFVGKSVSSALKLGQARGAAITAAAVLDREVSEYSARQIKQAMTGTGSADKTQIQLMVKTVLKLSETPQEDAADALACAICHAHTQQSLINMAGSKKGARSNTQRVSPSQYRHKRIS